MLSSIGSSFISPITMSFSFLSLRIRESFKAFTCLAACTRTGDFAPREGQWFTITQTRSPASCPSTIRKPRVKCTVSPSKGVESTNFEWVTLNCFGSYSKAQSIPRLSGPS